MRCKIINMSKKKPEKKKYVKIGEKTDLLEQLPAPLKVGRIVPTDTNKKECNFDSFKAKIGNRLNYNISETFVKLDAGDTKINVKNTRAVYSPAPVGDTKIKQSKRRRYSYGGPPQWKFVDEIWLETQSLLQKKYNKELVTYIKTRKRHDNIKANSVHKQILSLVGPDWFQELSPKQKNTINDLKCCVLKDIKNSTIINTQENLGNLGLVLRPNHKHIELSLKYCCTCPVEFLLILYQLINPKRTKYSLNDRLLLSAVVHLTMKDTLRELHVRIPSPPNNEETTKRSHIKQKRKKYDSPYLEPFTFKPNPPKFTGIYENKHIQYPESEYFSYIYNLSLEKLLYDEDIFAVDIYGLDEDEREIMEDLKQAQIVYNRLQKNPKIKLLRPTVLNTCKDFDQFHNKKIVKNDSELLLPSLTKLVESDEECECTNIADDDYVCCEHDFSKPCDCQDRCDCRMKSKIFTSPEYKKCLERKKRKATERIVAGLKATVSANTIPIIGGIVMAKSCDCLKNYQEQLYLVAARNKIKCQKARFIVGGVVLSASGPTYLISTVFIPNENNTQKTETANSRHSTCKAKDNPRSNDGKNQLDVVQRSSDEESSCRCKDELNKFLNSKCTCEQCNTVKRRLHAIYVKAGLRCTESGNAVNIIGGVQEQNCDCLEMYMETIQKLELYKKRIRARYNLKSQNVKYGISGVTQTPNGPVYIISGIRPPVECECARILREKEEEQLYLSNRAYMPPTGRVKYHITGTRHTPEGNVYIISQALAVEDCECVKLFDTFKEAHKQCLQTFEQYLKDTREEVYESTIDRTSSGIVLDMGIDNYLRKLDEENKINTNSYPWVNNMTTLSRDAYGPEKGSTSSLLNKKIYVPKDDLEKNNIQGDIPKKPLSVSKDNKFNAYGPEKGSISSLLNKKIYVSKDDLEKNNIQGDILKKPLSVSKDNKFNAYGLEKGSGSSLLNKKFYVPKDDLEKNNIQGDIPKKPLSVSKDNKFNAIGPEKASISNLLNEKCYIRKSTEKYDEENALQIREEIYSDQKPSDKNDDGCYRSITSTDSKCDCEMNSGTLNGISTEITVTLTPIVDTCLTLTNNLESNTTEPSELKRFVILENFPFEEYNQRKILKKVLTSMAQDGYSLAKLPDCHKLPHFKLWMQLRCGKYWTQKEKLFYCNLSKMGWHHTDYCYKETTVPQLGISKKVANQLTWKDAKRCRKIVSEKSELFYRKVKQDVIKSAREFFPLTFSYEFPNVTFKDCYFAYLPSKEEDVLAYNLVNP